MGFIISFFFLIVRFGPFFKPSICYVYFFVFLFCTSDNLSWYWPYIYCLSGYKRRLLPRWMYLLKILIEFKMWAIRTLLKLNRYQWYSAKMIYYQNKVFSFACIHHFVLHCTGWLWKNQWQHRNVFLSEGARYCGDWRQEGDLSDGLPPPSSGPAPDRGRYGGKYMATLEEKEDFLIHITLELTN